MSGITALWRRLFKLSATVTCKTEKRSEDQCTVQGPRSQIECRGQKKPYVYEKRIRFVIREQKKEQMWVDRQMESRLNGR